MSPYSIFVIDDEKIIREGIALALNRHYRIQTFESAEEGIKAIRNDPPDLILLDIGLKGMNGIDALESIKKLNTDILVVMITAYEDVETVVAAMKLGAYDYSVKPIHIETLLTTIRNALESIKMRKEIQLLQENYLKENQPWFISESDSMQDVMEFVKKVARSPDTPVLILGETGTGKELVANSIHYRSPNFKEPFIVVNCATFPRELIESELFGYEKGAFTGANPAGKTGFVEKAENGTLFLDEVGDLSLEAQTKLLRFLESGEFYKVGGTKIRQVKVRIISATNQDLWQMVEEDLFRKDLYYRLAVIKVTVPSLNKRPDDIIPIVKHYLVEFNEKFKKRFERISPEAEKALKEYHWKGNVRELRNMIERSVLIAEGAVLNLHDISLENSSNETEIKEEAIISKEGIDFPLMLETIEKQYLKKALKTADNNESKAANLLNLSRDTFRYRRKKLNID